MALKRLFVRKLYVYVLIIQIIINVVTSDLIKRFILTIAYFNFSSLYFSLAFLQLLIMNSCRLVQMSSLITSFSSSYGSGYLLNPQNL